MLQCFRSWLTRKQSDRSEKKKKGRGKGERSRSITSAPYLFFARIRAEPEDSLYPIGVLPEGEGGGKEEKRGSDVAARPLLAPVHWGTRRSSRGTSRRATREKSKKREEKKKGKKKKEMVPKVKPASGVADHLPANFLYERGEEKKKKEKKGKKRERRSSATIL